MLEQWVLHGSFSSIQTALTEQRQELPPSWLAVATSQMEPLLNAKELCRNLGDVVIRRRSVLAY